LKTPLWPRTVSGYSVDGPWEPQPKPRFPKFADRHFGKIILSKAV
jgi:hypothetical protein